MRLRNFTYLFLILALGLTSCNETESTESSESGNGTQSQAVRPNDSLAKLPPQQFSNARTSYTVASIDRLNLVPNDSIPWEALMTGQRPEGNDLIAYYFFAGEAIEARSAQVRVESMAKTIPGCSTVDSLHNRMRGLFLGPERQGVEIRQGTQVATLDGQVIDILQIRTPEVVIPGDSMGASRSARSMAWAYVDDGDDFIGFHLSAVDESRYEEALPLFKSLVGSYRQK